MALVEIEHATISGTAWVPESAYTDYWGPVEGWTLVVGGAANYLPAPMRFRDAYAGGVLYSPGDVVSHSGTLYVALAPVSSVTPGTDVTKWKVAVSAASGAPASGNFTFTDGVKYFAGTSIIKWRLNDSGGFITAKPLGDGTAGITDIEIDDTVGYLYHLRLGPNSGGSAAAIGIGCDQGSGAGLLIRNKAQGNGFNLTNEATANAGAGNGYGFQGKQKSSGGALVTLLQSNEYAGAVISGGTTVTLPAAFTAADVGMVVTGTGIPGGTTITAVNAAAGTATLSQVSTNGTVTITIARTTARAPLVVLAADATAVAGQLLQQWLITGNANAGSVAADTGLLRWYKDVQIDGAVNSPLNIGKAALASSVALNLITAAGQNRDITIYSGGTARWILRTSGAESTGDAGADMQLISRTDAGGFKANVLTFTRSTGATTFGGPAYTVASAATAGAGLRVPHGTAPTAPVNGDIWTTSSGLFVRINGATVGPLT